MEVNMYKKVSTDLNFVDREKQTEKFWEDNDIFRKSMRDREGNEIYMFYDGPPTANGKPHIGHVLTHPRTSRLLQVVGSMNFLGNIPGIHLIQHVLKRSNLIVPVKGIHIVV